MFKIIVVVCLSGFCSISDTGATLDKLEECLVSVAMSKDFAKARLEHPNVELHAFCVEASDIEGGLRIVGKDYRPWQNPDMR